MFNWFAKWSIKKWILGIINNALEKYKDNVQAALSTIDALIAKVEKILVYLKSVREKVADNKITDEEADAIIAEGEALVEDLLK